MTWYLPGPHSLSPSGGEADSDGSLMWSLDYPSAGFRAQVSTDPAFRGSAIVADSGQVFGLGTSWLFPPTLRLNDGQTYYWRVQSFEGSQWSDWVSDDFVWSSSITGTGIDASDDPPLTMEEMGYTQADVDAVNQAIADYTALDPLGEISSDDQRGSVQPDRPEPCPDCIPTSNYQLANKPLGTGAFQMWHEKRGTWCMPAAVGSILDYRTRDYTPIDVDHPTVYDLEYDLKMEMQNKAGLNKWPANGVGDKWALKVTNQDLGTQPKYVRLRPSSNTDLRIKSKSEVWTQQNPMYLDVNGRDTSWAWHIGTDSDMNNGLSIITHATLVIGFENAGDHLLVGDPYISDISQVDSSGFPHYDGGDANYSLVWSRSYGSLYEAMDSRPGKLPVWYALHNNLS